jgi:hypothetical protein
MAIIRTFHESTGPITRELTQEEIEDLAARGDEECRREIYKGSEVLSYLSGITYAQLETYIMNNVTNLAEARQYLIELSKVVLLLVKFSQLDGDD